MLTQEQKQKITEIAKLFAEGIGGSINGSGWLIVDPMSGYLNAVGWENKLDQLPATDKHPQVLIMTFKDGSQLIPAGSDLKKYIRKPKTGCGFNSATLKSNL